VSPRLPWAMVAVAVAALAGGVVLAPSSADSVYLVLISVPFVAVGALLALRRRDNPIGWLFLSFGLVAALDFPAEQYTHRALAARPPLPSADLATSLAVHLWHPFFGLFIFAFLLFPDGHLVSPRWRWVARVSVVTYVLLGLTAPFDTSYIGSSDYPGARPLVSGTLSDVATGLYSGLLSFNLLLLPVSGASLVLRLRRSSGRRREQVRLFAYTVATVMLAFPVIGVFTGKAYGILLFPLIPVAAGVAILRHRLYDLDVVVNRALVYGALTATLGATYLGSVLLLQIVLEPLTANSGLAIAASTLAVAALFRPARGRIQALVDRRFYRRRYDAARTLEAFSGRLRDELDLEALGADLRDTVRETVQPAHVSLWLRGDR
jgi:hypothetical protein